jgi:hypothetical protein
MALKTPKRDLTDWASKGAAGDPQPRWAVDGDGRRLILPLKRATVFAIKMASR